MTFLSFINSQNGLSNLIKTSIKEFEKRQKIKNLYSHTRCHFCYQIFDKKQNKPYKFKTSENRVCEECIKQLSNPFKSDVSDNINIDTQIDDFILKQIEKIFADKNIPFCPFHEDNPKRLICFEETCTYQSFHCHFCSKEKHKDCLKEYEFRHFLNVLCFNFSQPQEIMKQLYSLINLQNIDFQGFKLLDTFINKKTKSIKKIDYFHIDSNCGELKFFILQDGRILVKNTNLINIETLIKDFIQNTHETKQFDFNLFIDLIKNLEKITKIDLQIYSIKKVTSGNIPFVNIGSVLTSDRFKNDKLSLLLDQKNFISLNKKILQENQSFAAQIEMLQNENNFLKAENTKITAHNDILSNEIKKSIFKPSKNGSIKALSVSKNYFNLNQDDQIFIRHKTENPKFDHFLPNSNSFQFKSTKPNYFLYDHSKVVNVLIIYDEEIDCQLIQQKIREFGFNMMGIAIKSDRIDTFHVDLKPINSVLIMSKKHDQKILGDLLNRLVHMGVNLVFCMWPNHFNYYPLSDFQAPFKAGHSDSKFQNYELLIQNHVIFEGVVCLTDQTNFKYRIITEVIDLSTVDLVAVWEDKKPMCAIRYDLQGLITCFGFCIGEKGSLDGIRAILNALRLTKDICK